jgi:hypothetical protein
MLLTRARFILCFSMLVASGSSASAALLVYEPFDYQAGSGLLDQNGGIGFAGDWTGRNNNDGAVPAGSTAIQAAGLSHPSNPGALPTQGGSVLINGSSGVAEPAREFSAAARAAIAGSSTTWVSFLAQRQGQTTDPNTTNLPNNPYPRGVNFSLFRTDLATNSEVAGFGNSSNATDNTWSIIPLGGGGNREGAYDPAGGVQGGGPVTPGAATFPWNELQWAVIRVDHFAGNDDIYMWLSPDPDVEPSILDADATILNTDTNAIDYANIGAMRPFVGSQQGTVGAANWRPAGVLALDEIRIGTTYADMTATSVIPEPASLVLLSLAAIAFGLRRHG